jgi:hypothetical protein
MNTEALQQLRRVVESAPDDLFHMRAVVERTSCGTARCAIGWAAVDPWFQENTRLPELIPPSYDRKGLPSLYALNELFDISSIDANNLFAGSISRYVNEHAVSKEEVLWNIDELLAGRETLPYCAAMPMFAHEGAVACAIAEHIWLGVDDAI